MNRVSFLRVSCLLLSTLGASAAAQTVTPVLRVGDPLGSHTVKALVYATIDDSGAWDAIAYRDLGSSSVLGIELHDGVEVAAEHQTLPDGSADYVRFGYLEGGANNLAM